MARDDDWDEQRRLNNYREVRRREAARARGYGDYGDYDRAHDDDPRVGYRAAREDLWFESRRRERDQEDEARRRRDHAYRPFGENGPTAYSDSYYGGSYDSGPAYAPYGAAPYAGGAYGAMRTDYARQRYESGRFGVPPSDRRPDEGRSFLDKAADQVASWFGDRDAERRRLQDELQASHRGRGPKGYKRSDARIQEDINERLTEDPYLDATDIDVMVQDGDITLTGVVLSREDKRRAERLAEDISGVRDVQNNLRLRRPVGAPDEAIERPDGGAI
jgi:osmotically-inducible protein OsmY